jgi:hypothetical protein
MTSQGHNLAAERTRVILLPNMPAGKLSLAGA